jgi:hypothetical protein
VPAAPKSMIREDSLMAKRSLASERGFALAMAIIILFVITMLTGVAVLVASQISTSTTRDTSVKGELEAAEAGQHVAGYRLTELGPSEAQCVNESEVVEPSNSPCHDESESLGNGASFEYWTTVPLKAGETCAGRKVVAIVGVWQRCVTSEGSVNGVKPAVRLQSRVSAPNLFPVNGLFGLERVEVSNNTKVLAKGGTNGKFIIGNNASVEGVNLGPGGATQVGNNGSAGTVTTEAEAFALPAVKTGNSATQNSNYRIQNGLKSPRVSPYDESTGVTYNSATRALTVNGSLTLTGEVYNFCELTLGSGATITVQHKPTKIYIDGSSDPGAKCSGATGAFYMSNNSNIVNTSKEAAELQIYVYEGSVEFFNNVTFYGAIYAPNSTVNIKNNAEIYGAIAGNVVNVKNNGTFHSEKNVEALRGGPYQRAVWEQCVSGSGPTESC